MKKLFILNWLLCAALTATVAAPSRAEEKAADVEADDFKQFIAVLQSQNIFADRTDEQIKKDARAVIIAAEIFLKAHPASPNANQARLSAAQSWARLWRLESDPKHREEARLYFQQILDSKPDDDLAFQAHAFGLDLAEKPEAIAAAVENIVRLFPNHTQTSEVLMYLATVFHSVDDWDGAKQTAQRVADKYPKSFQAKMARELLDKLSFIGQTPELRFVALDGKPFDLKNLRGKVVLLDFWATWCGPCIAELPNVMKVYEQFHKSGFEIVGISLDRNKETARAFVTEQKLAWPQLVDEKSDIKQQFKVAAIPATFLLDRDGKVIKTDLRGEVLGDAVKALLEKK